MKKILLSLSCLAAFGLANAATVTLNCNDAKDFKGTYTETTYKEDGTSVQAYAHYQPIEELTIGDYKFTFSAPETATNQPAFYYAKEGAQLTIRLYADSKMTITAPEGTEMGSIKINGSNAKDGFTFTSDAGKAVYADQVVTWGAETPVSAVTFTASGTYRINTLEISSEGGEEPIGPATMTFKKAETIVSGSKYVLVIGDQFGAAIAADAAYGRFNLTDVIMTDEEFEAPETNAITITEAEGKYTLVDAFGRYIGMDDTHLTSFQLYTEPTEGCYWTITMEDGEATITNALNTDCIVCQSYGEEGTPYTNIAPAEAPEKCNLPALYEGKTAGVADITAIDENAPVEYYNLQGVRVAEPTSGLYIRRQGNVATKVLVK